MNSPTVSVIMTVFNGDKFLAETIESVLNQSFRDFEFLVVDDGSTDATADILSKYVHRDGRIRVLGDGKRGRSASLNLAISLANGKYVANTDADDLSMPRRIEEQVAFMERNPEVGVLGSAYELVTESGVVIDTVGHPLEDSQIRSVMLRYNPICHSSVILRKDIVLATTGYRSTFEPSEDYDLWLRMSERSRLANLDNVLVRYRLHGNQLSIRKIEHQTLCVLAASAAAEQRRRGKCDPFDDNQEITLEIVESLGVTPEKMRAAFAGAYGWWSALLKDINPDAALELIDKMNQVSRSGDVEPGIFANAGLRAARIYLKKNELARALVLAGSAALHRPSAVNRGFVDPIRRALRARLWHPLLNLTRPIRHSLGIRQKNVPATHKEGNVHKDLADKNNLYQDWAGRDFAAPSPHFVKESVLLRNGLRNATWVETGTYTGETTTVLSKVAKMVYSIEPEPTLFASAERKFRNISNVKIINGLSEEVFPELLPTIRGNTCFWLDGHYSAGITFKGPKDTPVIDELSVIGRSISKKSKIVVMVDDIRCFDPKIPDFSAYPPVDFLVDWARQHNLTWHIEHDIFIAKNY
jgi:hypothetical protein